MTTTLLSLSISLWVLAQVAAQPESFEILTTERVQSLVADPEWILVDARLPDAYNGWPLDNVPRGGHIPGAIDFSARWLDVPHERREEILTRALTEKGLQPGKHIVVYDATGKERDRVAADLRARGLGPIYLYDIRAWAQDEKLPLERYPNYQLLVPPSVVKSLLEQRATATFSDPSRVKFAEVSWGDENASYAKGHVPMSFHINTDSFEPPPKWMLGSPEQLARFAAAYGLTHRDTVILSGEDPLASFRLSVVLRYLGVHDVRVLNGGLAAWKWAGYAVETEHRSPPSSGKPFGVEVPGRPQLIDTYEEVLTGLKDRERFTLVDNRTWAEHVGETSGYVYHSKKGRIPGSVYGYAGESGGGSLSYYRNIDNTMRSAVEIRRLWKAAGIDPNKHLSFMCGSGWRAAEVLTYAQVIGLDDVSLYSDGWIGWSNDPQNPIQTGPP